MPTHSYAHSSIPSSTTSPPLHSPLIYSGTTVVVGVVCILVPLMIVLSELGCESAHKEDGIGDLTHSYSESATLIERVSCMFSIVFAYSIQILQVYVICVPRCDLRATM
jgi:hypothetical protein